VVRSGDTSQLHKYQAGATASTSAGLPEAAKACLLADVRYGGRRDLAAALHARPHPSLSSSTLCPYPVTWPPAELHKHKSPSPRRRDPSVSQLPLPPRLFLSDAPNPKTAQTVNFRQKHGADCFRSVCINRGKGVDRSRVERASARQGRFVE
jgi:hypothetical protein